MLTLGIETSCDETAAAVTSDGTLVLSNVVASSQAFHAHYGGVVPEIASRAHVELIGQVVQQALAAAGVAWGQVELIAVTAGPGLVGSLLVGISMAQALGAALGLPVVGVHHLKAHLYANFMRPDPPGFPCVGLVVSGGHTDLVSVEGPGRWVPLGRTRDDAVGEAFDKVAKLLGLGYPGGPRIEACARRGNPRQVRFPRASLGPSSLEFSFSGLKTAVLYYVQRQAAPGGGPPVAGVGEPAGAAPIPEAVRDDVAASFQEAAVEVLVEKAMLACARQACQDLVIGGGVSINERLRARLAEAGVRQGVRVWAPERALCLDNAAMVSGLGAMMYRRGLARTATSLSAEPGWPFDEAPSVSPHHADGRGVR